MDTVSYTNYVADETNYVGSGTKLATKTKFVVARPNCVRRRYYLGKTSPLRTQMEELVARTLFSMQYYLVFGEIKNARMEKRIE